MDLFPSIKKSLESHELSKDDISIARSPIFHSIEYQLSTIVDKIMRIDSLDVDEIKNIIVRQHSMILNYDLFLKSEESRKYAQILFTSKKFLNIFLSVIGFLDLSKDEIICINKLAYDYYITEGKDKEVSDYLLQISYQINNVLVIRLSSKLGINDSRILSMIANSSFREEKNIHRVNTFLVKCNRDLSVQNMIDIYCILYDRFTYPFIYTMMESKPLKMTDLQSLHFDYISLAILNILDSMTSEDIKKILYNYAFILKLVKTNFTVRFSLKSVKNERIKKIIEEIELDPIDELIIP